ncbi:hypothetical protein H1D32_13305 [Anaerobacillus sp. CMMVII]|uniref:hypothetical protein n=1 Tax=Anaerobacillus sp. CMMVII TaxID=2755588 RepID=UPI0021B7FDC8|nr:hypothetical protein [Anaerobacillus sp. CMMVII]MCT8138633.1 hypothetical protein [Anaerobacillus sp. CMMVII]
MGKKLTEDARIALKNQYGIHSANNKKACLSCYNYNPGSICSKYHIKVKKNETCKSFTSKRVKIYRGGGVSPR